MSRKGAPVSFASRGMFDVLGTDGNDVEEEEEEDEGQMAEAPRSSSLSVSSPTPQQTPLSKSARKRLAKQAGREPSTPSSTASSAIQTVKDTFSAVPDGANSAIPDLQQLIAATHDKVAEAFAEVQPSSSKVNGFANGIQQNGDSSAASEGTTIPPVGDEDDDGITLAAAIPHPNPAYADAAPIAESLASPSKPNVPAGPPSTSFAPELPYSLPHIQGNALPFNRKRKSPTDFTPTGPRSQTPLSPSKLGVKFEDGILPGEGEEGETIIAVKKAILKKDRNVVERTIWTFIMIGGFIALLSLGHPYVILLTLLCQTLVYKEVTALFDLRDEGAQKIDIEGGDRWSKTLNWYFFVVTNYFLYGESIIYYFKHIVFVDALFIPFARNHRFISFMLYVVGFVGFVANLQRQYLRQQFALFCWVHISLLLIVVSSHFIVNNILEGLIWLFIPASLVICNDVMAYVCGKLFGRTPLIKLSPKKTVEGFVGAFICTLIFGFAWGTFFMRFPYMICPARDLGTNVFSEVSCRPNPVFIWRNFEFTGPTRRILQTVFGQNLPSIPYAPFQLHVLVMATFASLVAPFGGFFASGFKRAFNIKDFGHSIPGHGGMTDRMDCQFMMGLFSYVYYSSLIRIQYVTVGSIMQTVVTSLSAPEQLELLRDLRKFLDGQGIKIT